MYVSALNGLAGIDIIENKFTQAADNYRHNIDNNKIVKTDRMTDENMQLDVIF